MLMPVGFKLTGGNDSGIVPRCLNCFQYLNDISMPCIFTL